MLAHETFLGKGVTLLLGGMAIDYLAGPDGIAPLKPLFVDLFKGAGAVYRRPGLVAPPVSGLAPACPAGLYAPEARC